jgi:diaminopimelate epimerase
LRSSQKHIRSEWKKQKSAETWSNRALPQASILKKLCLPKDLGICHVSCISVGNSYLVLFCKNILDEEQITTLGAALESRSLFQNKINILIVHIADRNEIALTVFERRIALILACGSGANASAAIAHINRAILSTEIVVPQKGGELMIYIDIDASIIQIGSAPHVFSGETEL